MARSFTRGRGRLGASRKTLWAGFGGSNTNLAAGAATIINSANAALLLLRPFTIVRTRLVWNVRSDQAAVTENYAAAIGLAVVSDQAVAVGVTAVPTPVTDVGSDLFLMWSAAISQFNFLSSVGFHPASGVMSEIDSKAMRKVDDDQDIVLVVEDEPTIGTDGVNVAVFGRLFIKLH